MTDVNRLILSEWGKRELADWSKGQSDADHCQRQIDYFKRERQRFVRGLARVRKQANSQGALVNEVIECRYERLEKEIAWYDETLDFYRWLQQQPRGIS